MKARNPLTVVARLLPVFCFCIGIQTPAWGGIGTVTHVSGVLVAQHADGKTTILAPQSEVEQGDVLSSETNTFARIRFIDGGNLLVRPNSRVVIDRYQFEKDKPQQDSVNLSLVKGGLRVITGVVGKRSMDRHTTTTATATIGIRGTHFGLQACQNDCSGLTTLDGNALINGLHIDVLNGTIVAKNSAGEQLITAGQFGYVRDAQSKPELVPEDSGYRAGSSPNMATAVGQGNTVGLDSNDNICLIK